MFFNLFKNKKSNKYVDAQLKTLQMQMLYGTDVWRLEQMLDTAVFRVITEPENQKKICVST